MSLSTPSSIAAEELADRLNGKLHGDAARRVYAVATLEQADERSLSWVGSEDLLPRASASNAGILLLPVGCPPPHGRTAVGVADPDLAVCQILEYLAPPPSRPERGVHPTATVSAEATIEEGACIGARVYVGIGASVGAGTHLHAGVYVGDYTRLGRDCVLWPNVVVRERITVGDRVVIHPNSTIGADGFGYLQRGGKHVKIPQVGTVVIEDDVEIGANSAIDRARSGATRIGRGTKIDNLVQVGHNVEMGEGCLIVSGCSIGGSSTLGKFVVMAGQVGVTDHCKIGDGVQIAGKSSVLSDIPDGRVVRGIPAIENRRFLRQEAAARKLPRVLERLRELIKRVDRIEGSSGDRPTR